MRQRGGRRNWLLPAPLAFAVALLAGAASAQPRMEDAPWSAQPSALPFVVNSNLGAERWLRSSEPIEIELDRLPRPGEGRLVVFVGPLDVTSQLRIQGSRLRYLPRPLPLEHGESEVVVYLASEDDERWGEIARLPLRVLTRLGVREVAVREAEIDPRLDGSLDSQLAEDHSADATPPREERYAHGTFQLGVETRHRLQVFEAESRFEFVGASFERGALRFAEEGSDAPPFDLSEYRIDLRYHESRLSAGHLRYGDQRHLIDAHRGRGFRLSQRLGSFGDVSFAALSSTRIVGVDNFSGVQDSDDLLLSGTLGINLMDTRRARARLETTLLHAERPPRNNFNAAQVTDTEKSRGFGFVFEGEAFSGRLRAEGGFARSTFDNPEDPDLFGSFDVVAVKRQTDDAYYAEGALELLRDFDFHRGKTLSLEVSGSYERADPLYRSLAAFTRADSEQTGIGATADVAGVALRVRHGWQRDNLDDVPGVLVTRTRNLNFSLSAPLPYLLPLEGRARSFIPRISYSLDRTQQYGTDSAGFFGASAIPDQVSWLHDASLDWYGERWDLGYRLSYSLQDNRQPGREDADFETVSHDLSAGLRPLRMLDLNASYRFTVQDNREFDIERRTHGVDAGARLRFPEGWTTSVSGSYTFEDDSRDERESVRTTIRAELAKRFEIPLPHGRRQGLQVFVRWNRQASQFDDNVFGFSSSPRTWTFLLGANASVF